MKKTTLVLVTFTSILLLNTKVQSQTLETVTNSGNTTPNAVKITGVANLPTGAVDGLELYFQNGGALINSFNRGNGTRLPMTLNASTFNLYSNRFYYANRAIAGNTEDGQGPNYLLLHKAYTSTLISDSYVMGKVSAIRGGTGAWNRKLSLEVNTASAYNSNRGSLISYNEAARLVTLTYNSETYLAIEVLNASSLYTFTFTGHAANESLLLVKDDNVTNVQEFTPSDAVNIQGKLALGYFGSGIPSSKIHMLESDLTKDNLITINNTANGQSRLIVGTTGSNYGVTNQAGHSVIESYNNLHLSAAISGNIYFETGRTNTVSPVKMMLTNSGSLTIGVTDPYALSYKLAVNGSAIFTKVVVKNYNNWADYVFDSSYQLTPLNQLEKFLQQHKHLPEVPSATDVAKEGIDLGNNQVVLLKKIEELTLYTIQQHKQLEAQKQEYLLKQQQLEAQNKTLEDKLKQLEQKLDQYLSSKQ